MEVVSRYSSDPVPSEGSVRKGGNAISENSGGDFLQGVNEGVDLPRCAEWPWADPKGSIREGSEVRVDVAWHHHMTLAGLAHLFVALARKRLKNWYPQ